MSGLSHLDELEAEAIYIIREVAAALFYRKRQFCNASSCNEGFLSGETAISVSSRKYNMEI